MRDFPYHATFFQSAALDAEVRASRSRWARMHQSTLALCFDYFPS